MSNSHDRSYSSIPDEWNSFPPPSLEDLDASMRARKEAALDHQAISFYSDQGRKNYESTNEEEGEEQTSWVEKYWIGDKQGDSFPIARNSLEKPDFVKTLQMDTAAKQYPYHSTPNATNIKKTQFSYQSTNHQRQATPASPRQRYLHLQQPPLTPSPAKNRTSPLHVRSGSPRRVKEEKSFSTANSPSLRSFTPHQRLKFTAIPEYKDANNEVDANYSLPNYMAATESAKARVRSQSAPRQRPSTPERERGGSGGGGGGLAKKRLSYPVPEPYYINSNGEYCCYGNLRSPSFKSLQAGYLGMERNSCQSCYTDSIAGENSPCSTTDLRRWFR